MAGNITHFRKRWILLFLLIVLAALSGCVGSTLTPGDVLSRKESLVGQRINVMGTAGISRAICTQAICTAEDPCCNSCSGTLVIGSDGETGVENTIALGGEYDGREVRCWGTDCRMLCHPVAIGVRYIVTGIWNESNGEYYLELEGVDAV